MTSAFKELPNLSKVGAFANHGFSRYTTLDKAQEFLTQHSSGRLRLLRFELISNRFGPTQAEGSYYCRDCGTILTSVLQPHLLNQCPVCHRIAASVKPKQGQSFWGFDRFCNSEFDTEAQGIVYLFQLPDDPNSIKFGFSYDPITRAKGSPLYGPLLWQSRVTTRALARVVELDLQCHVHSGIFGRPKLSRSQRLAAGSSEIFTLREPWSLESIIIHLEATLNRAERMGWKAYWMKYLDGIDGCPSND